MQAAPKRHTLSDDGEAKTGLEVQVLEVAAEAVRHTAAAKNDFRVSQTMSIHTSSREG